MANNHNSLALYLLGFEDMFSNIEELQVAIWKDAERFTRRKKHTRRWNRWQLKRR